MATEIATDNFNRADNSSVGMNLGANWTGSVPQDDLGINTNQAYQTANTDDNAAFWSANTFHTDHYSQATLSTVTNPGNIGLVVRATTTDNVLGQNVAGTGDMAVYWYNGGSYTQIGSTYTTSGFSNGDVAKLDADGGTFTLYQNGNARVTGSNTSAPIIGSPGILLTTAGERLDDWSGGNLYDMGIIAIADSNDDTSVSSVTLAVTIPTGYTNLGLLVNTQTRDASDTDRLISTVVWNTTESLTKLREENNNTYDITAGQWLVANPTTGTHNVVVTPTGTVDAINVTAVVIAGMNQTGQPDASNGASAATGHPTVDVTSTVNNCLIFDSLYTKDNVSPTAGAGQMAIARHTVNGGGDGMGASYERKAIAGATTMSWTQNLTNEQWIISGVSIAPYVAPAGTVVKDLISVGVIAFPR
jgi:hypothetical protein